MVERLCTSGNHEALKCSVHAASGFMAGLMAAYNLAACCYRNDLHLRVNVVVYSLLVAYELKHTVHHFSLINSAARPVIPDTPLLARCA